MPDGGTRVSVRWLLVDEHAAPLAGCADVDGLFVDPGPPQHATLVGCRAEPPLPGAHRITASLHSVAWDGTTVRTHSSLSGAVTEVRDSALGGRHVTDLDGFYCALGEAVNGPGGYFGWNADALHDCAGGGWGAQWPFRVAWHDSAVARAHLVEAYDPHRQGPAVTLATILRWLAADDVEVDLR